MARAANPDEDVVALNRLFQFGVTISWAPNLAVGVDRCDPEMKKPARWPAHVGLRFGRNS